MGFVLGDRQGLEVRCKAKVREQTALVLLCKSVQSQLLLRSAQNTLVEPIRLLSESCCIDRPCSRHRNGFAATFLLLGDWIVHPRERCTTAFYLLLSSEKWAAADGSHYGVDAAAPDESDVFVFFVLPLSLDSRRYSSQLLALMALLLNLVMTPFSTQPHVCGGCLPSFSSGRIQTMLLPSVPVSVSGHPCVCVCCRHVCCTSTCPGCGHEHRELVWLRPIPCSCFAPSASPIHALRTRRHQAHRRAGSHFSML